MANALDKKNMKTFSNEVAMTKAVYSLAAGDSGAVGVIDLMEAKEAIMIHRAYVKVETTFTSGGSATLEVGVKGGDTDAVLAATAVASLTAPSTFPGAAASEGLYLASGGILSAEIKVAAMTAGKLELVVEFSKF